MTRNISIEQIHLVLVGALWLGALPVIIYTYRKVSRWRKPLYALAIPIVATMTGVYFTALLRTFGVNTSGVQIGLLTRVSLFLIALLFYLVPYVDRLEARTKNALAKILADSESVQEQLTVDQRLMLGDQRTMLDDQESMLGEQQIALNDSKERPDDHPE
jgi:hypothetical protein